MENMDTHRSSTTKKMVFLGSLVLCVIGSCGGPLISRLYFLHGGSRVWLSTWLQNAGCPILLLPIAIFYSNRRKTEGSNARVTFLRLPVFAATAVLGLSTGLASFFYSYGIQRIPVSTSTILVSTTLIFTAVFAFFIVKQKFTAYSVNAVVLLMVGAVLLGLRTSGDKPEGETKRMYILGFTFTLASSALNGSLFPIVELLYKRNKEGFNFTFLLEVQFVVMLFASAVAMVAMLINKDFQAIAGEARKFDLGEASYYLILVFTSIVWQCSSLGIFGILYSSSALVVGITNSALVPVTEVLAAIAYREKFQAEKGVSLVLSLWGFASYFYGEYKKEKKIQVRETEVTTTSQSSMIKTTPATSDV